MTDLLRNGIILLMVGSNFTCLYIIVGFWLRDQLPDRRLVRTGLTVAVFATAVLLTFWGMIGQQSSSQAEPGALPLPDSAKQPFHLTIDYPAL